jgi:hypothetical protein
MSPHSVLSRDCSSRQLAWVKGGSWDVTTWGVNPSRTSESQDAHKYVSAQAPPHSTECLGRHLDLSAFQSSGVL